MKKIICEICGSQFIKKRDGIFICQECGTEYTLDEARKLLKEVDECKNNENQESKSSSTNKEKLLCSLYCWAKNILALPDSLFWLNQSDINNEIFWKETLPQLKNHNLSFIGTKLPNDFVMLNALHGLSDERYNKYRNKKYPDGTRAFNEFEEKNFFEDRKILKRFYKQDVSLVNFINSSIMNTSKAEEAIKDFFKKYGKYNINRFGDKFNTLGSQYYMMSFRNIYNDYYEGELLRAKYENGLEIPTPFFLANEFDYIKPLYVATTGIFRVKMTPASSDIQEKYKKMLKTCRDSVLDVVDSHNKLMDYCEANFDVISDVYGSIYESCLELEKEFYLPYKYREASSILDLIEMVKDGKAETWKELVNLYDTNEYRTAVCEKLDVINNKLDNIQNILVVGFKATIGQLSVMNEQLSVIGDKMNSINEGIDKIKKYSFITMRNTF